ncbi:MAG: PAS domain S-box protein [Desulfomonilaceae bacterium]|jgi:PAS domain S-box-containing protein
MQDHDKTKEQLIDELNKLRRKVTLRDMAEDKLCKPKGLPSEHEDKTPEEVIHELDVHQIELELQNEELRRVQLKLEKTKNDYQDLYDFSPVGYFTLTNKGIITQVNLTGAALLGMPRPKLINRGLGRLIAPENLDKWDQHLANVFGHEEAQTCDLRLIREDESTFYARLNSIRIVVPDEWERETYLIHTAVTDVSDRMQAEKELRESEERFRNFLNATDDLAFLKDQHYRYVFVNKANQDFFGLSEQEIIGKTDFELMPEELAEECLKSDRRAIAENDIVTVEERSADRIFEIRKFPVKLECQEVGVGAFIRDIIDRKRAEEALRASEERFRAVIQNLQIGISVLNPSMEIVAINPFFQKIYPRVQAGTGQLCFDSYNDPPRTSPCPYCPCVKTFQDGKVHESLTETPTGSQARNYRIISCPIKDAQGQVELVVELVEDVTEAKQSEEQNLRLAAIVEFSDDAIIGKTLDGIITSWNKGAENIYGYKEHEIVGKPVTILAPHDREDEIKGLLEQIKSGKSVQHLDTVRRNKIGDPIPVSLTISPIIDKEGNIVGASTISRDISDRVNAAQQRETLQEQLFHAQKMEAIGTLAGGFAHDFNNKLQVIAGYVELILFNKDLSETLKPDLELIKQTVDSSAELIKGMMAFSRKTPIDLQPIELNKLVTQTRAMLTRSIPKMIEIELLLADDLWAINAAPNQIDQILMNLAVNASDAMPDGGKLTIQTRNTALDEEFCRSYPNTKPGKYVLMIVSDTGAGMNKETVYHIFEPFFTTKAPGKGTGLGLAVVYGIVEQHGGRIVCDSQPSVGTTFSIYFPAIEEVPQEQHSEKKEPPRGRGETILVVDDEANIIELTARILNQSNYRVITAVNGEEALELYEKHGQGISLVILDLMMPGMGGRECLRALLKKDPKIRVLVASGGLKPGVEGDLKEAGEKGTIRKPFDMANLLEKIRKILDED